MYVDVKIGQEKVKEIKSGKPEKHCKLYNNNREKKHLAVTGMKDLLYWCLLRKKSLSMEENIKKAERNMSSKTDQETEKSI